ncbi:MAG TPA: class I SAM-dependent methyltransferase [Spirochaetota bacterium]|nr:class I SAM-dependent methyltransferase [Spirochaetota bacterium]
MAKIAPFENYSDDYDRWFIDNSSVYAMELDAVRGFIPADKHGLDIGVGTGKFAIPFGIKIGIDPSFEMAVKAKRSGIDVSLAVAEALPFKDEVFNFVLMVTSVCFFDDVNAAFNEAFRVLKPGGVIIIGFVDSESELGKRYIERKERSRFYSDATFYSVPELTGHLQNSGFSDFEFNQTVFMEEQNSGVRVRKGYGEGSFVVIKGVKR